jgi:hypothetical protein
MSQIQQQNNVNVSMRFTLNSDDEEQRLMNGESLIVHNSLGTYCLFVYISFMIDIISSINIVRWCTNSIVYICATDASSYTICVIVNIEFICIEY